jgi:Fur family transcriptional regulator, ferric uptake regulator
MNPLASPRAQAPARREIARFSDFLRERGLKITSERTALVAEIFAIHYHFDADELLFKLKEKNIKISRATIYRTLELLVKAGLVRRVHLGEDHYHYERITRDTHHDHLVCTTCGAVIEFSDPELQARQREICEKKRFVPTSHNLQILGICDKCQRKGSQPDLPDRIRMEQIAETSLRK